MSALLDPVVCPVCEKLKPPKSARDPRCGGCYRKELRAIKRAVPTALEQIAQTKRVIAKAEEDARTLSELVAEAERELQLAIPEAARGMRLAIQMASIKGDSKPAETILQQYAVPGPDNKPRRLLEPTPKPGTGTGTTGPQIIIGFKVEAPAAAPIVAAHAVNQSAIDAPTLQTLTASRVSGQPVIDVTAVTAPVEGVAQ